MDLPEPVVPRMATVWPGLAENETSPKISRSLAGVAERDVVELDPAGEGR